MAWDELAEPRTLLAALARENGLEIEGLDRVPHDLWPAADWPPMSLVDRLTLIAQACVLVFLGIVFWASLPVIELTSGDYLRGVWVEFGGGLEDITDRICGKIGID